MSKQSIAEELVRYFESTDQDAGEWPVDLMAEELDKSDIDSIDELDPDDFTEFVQYWDGKVGNYRGNPIEFKMAMSLADRDLCEQIVSEGVGSNQEFIERYVELHAQKYDGEEFAPYFGYAW